MRRWTAPKSGNIFVRALPRGAQPTPGCGDGVVVTYKAAGVLRFTSTLAWDDTVGGSILDTVAVAPGQILEFLVEKNSDNYCDNTFLEPTIGYY